MKKENKKDTLYARIAFYLSLGFWVPLFNIALCLVSAVIAIPVLRRHYKNPTKYGGFGYALAALLISLTGIILTIIGLIVYLHSQQFCGSAYCELFNS